MYLFKLHNKEVFFFGYAFVEHYVHWNLGSERKKLYIHYCNL